jgi:hypothetical protein
MRAVLWSETLRAAKASSTAPRSFTPPFDPALRGGGGALRGGDGRNARPPGPPAPARTTRTRTPAETSHGQTPAMNTRATINPAARPARTNG